MKTANFMPVFGKTRFGNPMILVGKHKFWSLQNSKNGRRWICSKKNCKAMFFTRNDVIVSTSGEHNHSELLKVKLWYLFNHLPGFYFEASRYGGKVLRCGVYRYRKHSSSKPPRTRWFCTRKNCNSAVVMVDQEIVFTLIHQGMVARCYAVETIGSKSIGEVSLPKVGGTAQKEIMTRFGGQVLCCNGYRYRKHTCSQPNMSRWICIKTRHGCKTTVVLVHDQERKTLHLHKILHQHNH
uniref:SFRICE_017637 n=1 Tax=Spodoptera frugiperda TaxID=7108 RepID=A0A2H1W263_SPOFR